ncbi:large ribosomal subunit protein bL19m-like [Physella acuta]|uniref:large ribosomal subunit protein bL19m-like n=1 Tax=Physella acuta TaxID=109671 RepID=UPI0027DE402A|nr:large ribosomal subunit protein bL19m-like [Physella acuta]
MAASICHTALVWKSILRKPLLLGINSLSCSHVSVAHKTTHVVNYKRTRAEVDLALRKKPNYLHYDLVDKYRHSPLQKGTENIEVESETTAPRDYRFIMPEFMPNPDFRYRDRVLEKLERRDMLRRRNIINIPEFYVGSIMAVTISDPHSPGKTSRFVGLCIDRGGHGLRAFFVLRNIVDGLGVEIRYLMYNPVVHSIEVLKLEKRLDDMLYYLRDCPPEHSTISFDFSPVPLSRGAQVPVNPIKVKLNPKPWDTRWERFNFQGIEPIDMNKRMIRRLSKFQSRKPWLEKDIMVDYRKKVNEEEEESIMAEVYKEKQIIDSKSKLSKAVMRKKK